MTLPLTLENVLLSVKEFIEVWINQIIYYNSIYSPEIFDRFKSFDLIIFKSRNPNLNLYIESLVNDFIKILISGEATGNDTGVSGLDNGSGIGASYSSNNDIKHENGGKVNQLIVIIYDLKSTKRLRRYILNFNQFIGLSSKVASLDFLRNDYNTDDASASSNINIPQFTWAEIYSQFKSMLYLHKLELNKFHTLQKKEGINENNENYFFKILLNVDDSIDLSFGKSITSSSSSTNNTNPSNWIKLNDMPTLSPLNTIISTPPPKAKKVKFIPIGEVSIGFLCFDLHNEYN